MTEHHQHSLEPLESQSLATTTHDPETKSLSVDAFLSNLNSLRNIIREISSKLNHQVLGNCDVLMHMEAESVTDSVKPIMAFKAENIDALIKGPVKLALGRLNGLHRVIDKLEEQARNI